MKKKMIMTIALLTVLTVVKVQANDGSSGFCVQHGKELKLKNAIIVIKGRTLNNKHIVQPANHTFFNFQNGSKVLTSFDWGGGMTLEKVKLSREFGHNIAIYQNYLHDTGQGRGIRPILVQCLSFAMRNYLDTNPSVKLCYSYASKSYYYSHRCHRH
jgi:hypothetical protein